MTAIEQPHPFWAYSLAVYARPGVEAACLALQEAGADVNLLLLCCWLGSLGRCLEAAQLRHLMTAASAWQEQVLVPLRQARRNVKIGMPGLPLELRDRLRREIAAAELDAEHAEQLMLAGELERMAKQARGHQENCAAANLQRYLELLALEASAGAQVETLLAACGCRPLC